MDRAAAFVALTAVAACSEPEADVRTSLVIGALTDDNLVWLEREPAALAEKYRKMSTRTFDFFRGTAGVYWRDATAGGPVPTASAFADEAGAWLWIVGDPHLENVGTFRGQGGALAVDWNDLDATAVGPWWLDLRRLAVGLALAADELELGAGGDRVLVEAAVRAYAGETARLAAGGARRLEDEDAGGAAVAELIDDAAREGEDAAALAAYTRIEDGRRVMLLGDVVDPRADGVWIDTMRAVDVRERATVAAAIASWRPTAIGALSPAAATIKDVGRRLGAGVASYPVPRYYALLEGASAAPDDDVIVELKESTDPPPLAGLPPPGLVTFASAAERVVFGQRTFGARADNDPLLGHGEVAPISYRVRERTGYQRGIDLPDVLRDRTAAVALAATAGRLLAAAHGLAPVPGARGARALERIAPQVRGREDGLVTETTAFALAYADVIRADAAAFARALDERGPWLGAGR